MTLADIPAAIAMTDLEGWGYSAADFRRLHRLEPRGCLVAVSGGKRMGLTTAVSYGKAGWIGNVIVLPEFRGKGVGAELVGRATTYLQSIGVEAVRLNAYINRVQFYEGLGFEGEYENIRFTGMAPVGGNLPASGSSRPNLDQIASFDRRFFGAPRGRLLASLSNEFPGTFVSLGERKLRGYIVGQVSGDTCEIAPWVVDPAARGAARELWAVLSPKVAGATIGLSAPARSTTAMAVARWLGLRPVFRTLRMYLGKHAYGGRAEGIIGLGGLDKG